MTRPEFANVIAYLALGSGKSLPTEAAEVYYDLLGDLPVEVLRLAAKRVLLEHRWASFPSVAELRESAAASARGEVEALSAGEAWRLAWGAVSQVDPEIHGEYFRRGKTYPSQAAAYLDGLPPLVVEAIQAMGLPALCHGREPIAVVRGQFMKLFEQLAGRERRAALYPAAVHEGIAQRKLPAAATLALATIGKMDTPGEIPP